MPDFSFGDLIFIVIVLLVIHGSMRRIHCLRQRKTYLESGSSSDPQV